MDTRDRRKLRLFKRFETLSTYAILEFYDLPIKQFALLSDMINTSFIVVTHDLELAGKMQRQLRLVDGVLQAA